jgi:hypothetical protein
LGLEGLELFLLAGSGGLDHEKQEFGSVCRVFLFELKQGLIVVDGELDLFLQGSCLHFDLLGI